MAERAHIVDEAAADWIARRDRGDWTAEDQAAFDRWLAASTHNRVAWLRLNAAWEKADDLRAGPAKQPAHRWTWAAAAIAATLLAGVFAAVELGPQTYATKVGGSRAEMLDDGSRLELNTDSRVSIRQTGALREVRLDRGEAYFTVSHDRRPFVVEAGDYSVAANDGAFSVYRQGGRVLVAVESGKVAVRRRDLPAGAAQPVICNAGALLEARPEATRLMLSPTRVDKLLAWRRGLVTFDDARLADVVAEFNRYNKTQLVITDPALAEARVGGAFRPTNLDAFVRILGQNLGVTARREDGRVLLAQG
ncbi:MAG: FecR family protein [Parcubacteria group bacterium]